ncbi:MAG: hypothetical protein B9S36_06115 [Verrucomicrobiia bacterium Tous-C2TDCM]|jgi:hypothetical protein|nr:MAG: hypothetical protein B9S36_06115 [Verrucomicrobiae bacterium Tous-C2TDCM]
MSFSFLRAFLRLSLLGAVVIVSGVLLWRHFDSGEPAPLPAAKRDPLLDAAVAKVDAAFRSSWTAAAVEPTPEANALTLARRFSLALTGAVPSLEEIRRFENLPKDADPAASWLDHLFSDRRSADYLAERFARAFVGVETGPFLVYRRRRLVNWLGDQIESNRPYDAIVRDLVSAEGLWTTRPETNFITVTVVQGGSKEGPDELKLAGRTARAFLGLSLDCMQCHDDLFDDRWKQTDFHQLASFFAQTDLKLTGIHDDPKTSYQTRYLGETASVRVDPSVPYGSEFFNKEGSRREQLARWITHPDNTPFARAAVNRVWAILFGKPLVDPVDDLPIDGPFPAGLEELAREFTASGHDLRHLIRLIALSEPFRRESRSSDPDKPTTLEQEASWAAFPLTPLRPEQVAGSVIQSSTLKALDSETHVLQKLRRFAETQDFVKRYGDPGEEEFAGGSGTIPQRLLLMNGKLVHERTEPNPVMNSSTRIARYSPSDETAVKAAFLASLTRYPAQAELDHFVGSLAGTTGDVRDQALADLHWTLINTTEFSWNR